MNEEKFGKIIERLNNNLDEKLDLRENEFTLDQITQFSKVLKTNTKLVELKINGKQGDEGAKVLAEALKINSSLKALFIDNDFDFDSDDDYPKIGDEGAKALAEALKTNSSLKALDIKSGNIGEEGAKAIAEALKLNSTLTELDIRFNPIGNDKVDDNNGANAIIDSMQNNFSLQKVSLRTTSIGYGRQLSSSLNRNQNLDPQKGKELTELSIKVREELMKSEVRDDIYGATATPTPDSRQIERDINAVMNYLSTKDNLDKIKLEEFEMGYFLKQKDKVKAGKNYISCLDEDNIKLIDKNFSFISFSGNEIQKKILDLIYKIRSQPQNEVKSPTISEGAQSQRGSGFNGGCIIS